MLLQYFCDELLMILVDEVLKSRMSKPKLRGNCDFTIINWTNGRTPYGKPHLRPKPLFPVVNFIFNYKCALFVFLITNCIFCDVVQVCEACQLSL